VALRLSLPAPRGAAQALQQSMDELIGQISEELPPEAACRALEILLQVCDGVLADPGEDSRRTLTKDALQGELSDACFEVLGSCGFAAAGPELRLPAGADLGALEQARDILECCLLSCGHEPAAPARPADAAAGQAGGDPGAAGVQEAADPSPAACEAGEGGAEITLQTVERISAGCRARGVLFTDPEFPAAPLSLYADEADEFSWACERCTFRTELPPVPPLASSPAERQRQELDFRRLVRCGMCGAPATYRVYVQYFGRPTQWLRPGESCGVCEAKYGHLRGGRDIVMKMCSHYLRDTSSQMTVGAPWKLIRGEARADDVCQGGLGNCWFAGALSVVTRMPELIDNLLVTKEYNPTGAYAVRLCHAGVWRTILVDDLFPTSKLFSGYMDGVPEVRGTRVHYSRGGCPCYLQSERRQLWVPLLEKAAAKMFGCYAGLTGGTFGEALSLFTGCPVERLQISWSDEVRVRRALQRQARVEAREKLRAAGKDPDLVDLDDGEEETEDADLQWSRLASASEHGHLMGMGCASEECGRSQQEIVGMGLQAPHAYAILDVREVKTGEGTERLLKIRNPLGERADRTWKGAWGRDSDRWTRELKLELGVVNRADVPLEEGMGTFWMAFEDVKRFFTTIEVCRLHTGWHRSHSRAELASASGPGQVFELSVVEKTQVDVALWQERLGRREGDVRAADSGNADLGLAVLRGRGADAEGQPEYELVELLKRTLKDSVSGELILEGGSTYRLVPLCTGFLQAATARSTVLTVHSAGAVQLREVPGSWPDISFAVLEGCRRHGRRRPLEGAPDGVVTWTLLEEGGTVYAAENRLDETVCVKVDASKSSGCSSSRGGLEATTALPPRSRQILMALAFEPGRFGGRLLVEGQALQADAPAQAPNEGLHAPLPLPPQGAGSQEAGRPAGCAEGSLRSAPAEAPREQSGTPGQGRPAEEDGPAEAEPPPGSGPASGDSSGSPAELKPASSAKTNLQARIKQLFEEHQKAGMAPNEAAACAVRDAQREVGGA